MVSHVRFLNENYVRQKNNPKAKVTQSYYDVKEYTL
jgi:hypothetical protein